MLALAWNAIDVAKEHVIKDDLSDLDVSLKENRIEILVKSVFFSVGQS